MFAPRPDLPEEEDEETKQVKRERAEAEYKAAIAEEDAKHADAAAAEASWLKDVTKAGDGPCAWEGALATFHLVGRLGFALGETFESSREREARVASRLPPAVAIGGPCTLSHARARARTTRRCH